MKIFAVLLLCTVTVLGQEHGSQYHRRHHFDGPNQPGGYKMRAFSGKYIEANGAVIKTKPTGVHGGQLQPGVEIRTLTGKYAEGRGAVMRMNPQSAGNYGGQPQGGMVVKTVSGKYAEGTGSVIKSNPQQVAGQHQPPVEMKSVSGKYLEMTSVSGQHQPGYVRQQNRRFQREAHYRGMSENGENRMKAASGKYAEGTAFSVTVPLTGAGKQYVNGQQAPVVEIKAISGKYLEGNKFASASSTQ